MVQHLIWEILKFKSLNNENYHGVDCLKMKEFIFIFSYNDNEITRWSKSKFLYYNFSSATFKRLILREQRG